MNGPFIASDSNGAPCHSCGSKIRTGARVFYDGPRMADNVRTCASCVTFDLFGDPVASTTTKGAAA